VGEHLLEGKAGSLEVLAFLGRNLGVEPFLEETVEILEEERCLEQGHQVVAHRKRAVPREMERGQSQGRVQVRSQAQVRK